MELQGVIFLLQYQHKKNFSAENILKTSYCSQKDDYKWICLLETNEVHKKIFYFLGRRPAYADKIENSFNAIADSIDRSKCYSSLPLSTNLSNLSQLTSSAFCFLAAPESTVFLLQLGILGYVPSFPFFFSPLPFCRERVNTRGILLLKFLLVRSFLLLLM